jgi:hypothetical protein
MPLERFDRVDIDAAHSTGVTAIRSRRWHAERRPLGGVVSWRGASCYGGRFRHVRRRHLAVQRRWIRGAKSEGCPSGRWSQSQW